MADYFLDISDKMCPMTFVKTKLLIERMQAGQTAVVRLRTGEPLENVPRSVTELGHEIVSAVEEKNNTWLLTVRKCGK
ncbi:MAG: sulfurtransferase TusA family protein [Alphaproteobacteria bacterium]